MINRYNLNTNHEQSALARLPQAYENLEDRLVGALTGAGELAQVIDEESYKADKKKLEESEDVMRADYALESLNRQNITNIDDYDSQYKIIMQQRKEAVENANISDKSKKRYLKEWDSNVKPRFDKLAIAHKGEIEYNNAVSGITNAITRELDSTQTFVKINDNGDMQIIWDGVNGNANKLAGIISDNDTNGLIANKRDIFKAGCISFLADGITDYLIDNDKKESPIAIDKDKLIDREIENMAGFLGTLKGGYSSIVLQDNEKKGLKELVLNNYKKRVQEQTRKAEQKTGYIEDVINNSLINGNVIDLDKNGNFSKAIEDVKNAYPLFLQAKQAENILLQKAKDTNDANYIKKAFEYDVVNNKYGDEYVDNITNKRIKEQVKSAIERGIKKGGSPYGYYKDLVQNDYTDSDLNAVFDLIDKSTMGLSKEQFINYAQRFVANGQMSEKTRDSIWKNNFSSDMAENYKNAINEIFNNPNLVAVDKKTKKTITPSWLTKDRVVETFSRVMQMADSDNKGDFRKGNGGNRNFNDIKSAVTRELLRIKDDKRLERSLNANMIAVDNEGYFDPSFLDSGLIDIYRAKGSYDDKDILIIENSKEAIQNRLSDLKYGMPYSSLDNWQKNYIKDNTEYLWEIKEGIKKIRNKNKDYAIKDVFYNSNDSRINYMIDDKNGEITAIELNNYTIYAKSDDKEDRTEINIVKYKKDEMDNADLSSKVVLESLYDVISDVKSKLKAKDAEIDKYFKKIGVKRTAFEKGAVNVGAHYENIHKLYQERDEIKEGK